MARTVFILGAGASMEAGAPLMRDFLDVAELVQNSLEPDDPQRKEFNLVFRAIAELQSVFAKSTLALDNIESVFAAFEMASLFGRLGNFQQGELENLTSAIKSLIVATLEARLIFRTNTQTGQILPPSPYGQFADIIRQMRTAQDVTVMTFNYDLAMDYALSFHSLDADYFLSAIHPAGSIPLLKLHGSLNWMRCNSCQTIQATNTEILMKGFSFPRVQGFPIPIVRQLPLCVCGMSSKREPLIVPPTWNKAQHYTGISSVWSTAALHLSEAENIVVIGYSLPETDQFFRYLYALGTVSKVRLKLFWLINPDRGIRDRFEAILGPLAKDRVKVNNVTFYQAIAAMREEFLKPRNDA